MEDFFSIPVVGPIQILHSPIQKLQKCQKIAFLLFYVLYWLEVFFFFIPINLNFGSLSLIFELDFDFV